MPDWNASHVFFVSVALKSVAVLGVAWLTTLLLRRRSAAARHLVWTAASAALLALPFLSLSLPFLNVPVASALLPESVPAFRLSAVSTADASTSATAPRKDAAAPASRSWRPDWRLLLTLLWTAGAAVGIAQIVLSWIAIMRVRRSATRFADPDIAPLRNVLGINQPVDVLETRRGSMPMTFGLLRPAVLMPSDATEWSPERRRVVLLHELAHVRRGDIATHLLARTALSLYWWNPLAWLAWREFIKERERATDDIVLSAGTRASDYADHLLEIARGMHSTAAIGWAAVAMARPSQLEGRLLAILDSGVKRTPTARASAPS